MRLTHLADYAVVIMTAAARRRAGERLSAAALAAETGVPLPTAQKLLGKLANAGLLTSARGAGGGVTLARSPARISLADMVEAIEGPIAMTQCSGSEEASDCALDAHCRVKPHMSVVSHAVRGALAAVTLEQLASTPANAGVQPSVAARNTHDWAPAFAGVQG
uniref:SUF system Fe-S cluster assembly regulator n=1 Tax=uncultured Sphingomonas sp. TaxID=158754 RepID=UPI0025F46F89|nr:SUF system Fe-S cluster assembly regulator [uncultured Sphingomonas sp.]